jgi:hypothetical protein
MKAHISGDIEGSWEGNFFYQVQKAKGGGGWG